MSGSTKVINSLKASGLLEPPKTAGVPEASNWLILLSLMSWVILLRTSIPSCLVTDVVVFSVLPSGPTVEKCFVLSVTWTGFLVIQESLTL